MSVYEIPLKPRNQSLSVDLNGKTYNLTVRWLTAGGFWLLDIRDADDQPVAMGLPLVTGADLLEQFPDLDFGGRLYCGREGDLATPPGYDDLGSSSRLWWEPLA